MALGHRLQHFLLALVLATSVLVLTTDAFTVEQLERDELAKVEAFDEAAAREYLETRYETEMSAHCNRAAKAEFDYTTDLLNAEKEANAEKTAAEAAAFEFSEYESTISKFEPESFQDPELKRTFTFLKSIGTSKLPAEKFAQYLKDVSEMSKIYGTAKICPYQPGVEKPTCDLEKDGLNLEPEITEVITKPTPERQEELAHYWKAWRDATGPHMRDFFIDYVKLSNEAAVLNDKANMGEYWLMGYESETFLEDLKKVWEQLECRLYRPLYGYVRYILHKKGFKVSLHGPVGAHLFGDMWAQDWRYVADLALPFHDEATFDVTNKLKEMTASEPTAFGKAKILFDMANDFFVQTGMQDMKDSYAEPAMIVKPEGREVVCHASAWDMCDKKDFRIKMCTEINQVNFFVIHHELGHIQYFQQYKDKLYPYRDGANDGFHEAIGDTIALSVSSPKHLEALGLIGEGESQLSEKAEINYLMGQALEKVAFLPFGYMVDLYRGKVFSGEIPTKHLNREWVRIRGELQGIEPPVKRSEKDFDPGAKFHIPASVPYLRYFIAYLLQFQFHSHLCKLSGHTGPLYNCDIYKNPEAGAKFAEIMKAGASKPWNQVLLETLGTDKMDPGAMIEYFEPLEKFLKKHRAENGNYPLTNTFNAESYMDYGMHPPPAYGHSYGK